MRFLVRATLPNEAGNDMLRDPEFSSGWKRSWRS